MKRIYSFIRVSYMLIIGKDADDTPRRRVR